MSALSRSTPAEKWPTLLEPKDLSVIFHKSLRTIQRNLTAGIYGKWIELNGARVLRRGDLLAALKGSEKQPPKPPKRRRCRPGGPQ